MQDRGLGHQPRREAPRGRTGSGEAEHPALGQGHGHGDVMGRPGLLASVLGLLRVGQHDLGGEVGGTDTEQEVVRVVPPPFPQPAAGTDRGQQHRRRVRAVVPAGVTFHDEGVGGVLLDVGLALAVLLQALAVGGLPPLLLGPVVEDQRQGPTEGEQQEEPSLGEVGHGDAEDHRQDDHGDLERTSIRVARHGGQTEAGRAHRRQQSRRPVEVEPDAVLGGDQGCVGGLGAGEAQQQVADGQQGPGLPLHLTLDGVLAEGQVDAVGGLETAGPGDVDPQPSHQRRHVCPERHRAVVGRPQRALARGEPVHGARAGSAHDAHLDDAGRFVRQAPGRVVEADDGAFEEAALVQPPGRVEGLAADVQDRRVVLYGST